MKKRVFTLSVVVVATIFLITFKSASAEGGKPGDLVHWDMFYYDCSDGEHAWCRCEWPNPPHICNVHDQIPCPAEEEPTT